MGIKIFKEYLSGNGYEDHDFFTCLTQVTCNILITVKEEVYNITFQKLFTL